MQESENYRLQYIGAYEHHNFLLHCVYQYPEFTFAHHMDYRSLNYVDQFQFSTTWC